MVQVKRSALLKVRHLRPKQLESHEGRRAVQWDMRRCLGALLLKWTARRSRLHAPSSPNRPSDPGGASWLTALIYEPECSAGKTKKGKRKGNNYLETS